MVATDAHLRLIPCHVVHAVGYRLANRIAQKIVDAHPLRGAARLPFPPGILEPGFPFSLSRSAPLYTKRPSARAGCVRGPCFKLPTQSRSRSSSRTGGCWNASTPSGISLCPEWLHVVSSLLILLVTRPSAALPICRQPVRVHGTPVGRRGRGRSSPPGQRPVARSSRPALSPPGGGSGTGSVLLHYFSTNRVDSRGLRWIPVDSTAANKRLTSTVLDHKLRVVSQLPKHGRTGSTPAAFTAIEPCSPSRIRPVGRKSRNPPEPISTGRRRGPTSGIRVRARVRSAAALPRRRARVFCPAVIRPVPGSVGSVTRFFLRNQRPCR